jgi:predicted PurR-regulated permease PerM
MCCLLSDKSRYFDQKQIEFVEKQRICIHVLYFIPDSYLMMKKNFPDLFLLILIALVTFAFIGLIEGFLLAVFWAVIFAILFAGSFEKWLVRVKGKRNLAASITLLQILLIVILPLAIIGSVVVNEAIDYYQQVNSSEVNIQQRISNLRELIPVNDRLLEQFGTSVEEIEQNVLNFITGSLQTVASRAVGVTQNVFGFFLNLFLMLYILYFFLRDGKQLVRDLVWVLPIGDEREWTLLRRFDKVSRATVKGSLLVALVQGSLGGILFWIVGIPAAFIWGVIMVLLSLLPVGSAVIWLPAAIILIAEGAVGKGVAVILVGALLIGLVDNLLRPRLVGQDTKLPDYLILLSTLGGLSVFGISGFVLGPIIAALFVSCWQIMGVEYGGTRTEAKDFVEDKLDTNIFVPDEEIENPPKELEEKSE